MDKQKKQMIMLGVLLFILIIVFINGILSINRAKKPKPSLKEQETTQSSSIGAAAQPSVPVAGGKPPRSMEDVQKLKSLDWKKDPFNANRTIQTEKLSLKSLIVTGIVWDPENPYVIINGQVLKKHEKIDSFEIIEITQTNVIVKEGEQLHELTIGE